jgi:L-asparaginase/beta-aspartyl-peptidase (threonine type)
MATGKAALAIHGGAGARRSRDYSREVPHMRGLVEAARDRLSAGASALDIVVETVQALEASGLYVAGRGASPNQAGRYELDAALMEGSDQRAGSVGALVGYQSPIAVARAVMERTPHVMLAGEGAAAFADRQGFDPIENPTSWFTRAGSGEDNRLSSGLAHGTVGCVALDQAGRLAAATSTGGVFDKLPGRVGDCPLIGAGTWADRTAAVSCTGQGEYFIRANAAAQVAWRMRLAGEGLDQAAVVTLAQVGALGGDGGLIAIDAEGRIAMPYNSQGMKRACLHPDGRIEALVFEA